jgi:Tfp pilus assembly protein FimT
MRGERGVTVIQLGAVLAILAVGIAFGAPILANTLARLRAHGAVTDLYAALHLTKARARATGVMHALVLDPDGRTFRIEEDPTGSARTVVGPHQLVEGVVATGNATIRFSPKGFAVPFGTITVQAGSESHRLIVNILGRVRVAVD